MMKSCSKALSAVLAVCLLLSAAAPALAAGPTFNDVPESYWGYADIEAVAEAGLMNGTGEGQFSPEMKVSAAQFLTLLGRLVFPNVKTEGADWYGPYVAAAQEAGLLTGSQVDVNSVEAEISRYDMAVILRAAAKKLGVAEKTAQSSEVADYLDISNRYTEAVLAVYGMGLIKGDQAGNFNGSNTMMRAEVATVIMRLAKAKPSQGGGADPQPTTEPEKPAEPEQPSQPTEPQMVTAYVRGAMRYYPNQGKAHWYDEETELIDEPIPFKLLYTTDGGLTSQTILEGKTEDRDCHLDFSVDNALLEDPKGQFYISARYEKDGKTFVTQDLRTDGRKALSTVSVFKQGHKYESSSIKLVPPDGQRWDFELKGEVPNQAELTINEAGNFIIDKLSPAGFTVQLVYYPEPIFQAQENAWMRSRRGPVPTGERIVIAETTAAEDGNFVLPVSIDTVDVTNTLGSKNFRIEIRGEYNGKEYFSEEGEDLQTLSDIKYHSWRVNLLSCGHLTFNP